MEKEEKAKVVIFIVSSVCEWAAYRTLSNIYFLFHNTRSSESIVDCVPNMTAAEVLPYVG